MVENSKEGFRKMLQAHFPDPDILLNKDRMEERYGLARDNEVTRLWSGPRRSLQHLPRLPVLPKLRKRSPRYTPLPRSAEAWLSSPVA